MANSLDTITNDDIEAVRGIAERAKDFEASNTKVTEFLTSAAREVMEKTSIFDWNNDDLQLGLAKEARNYLAASSTILWAFKNKFNEARILRDIGLEKVKTISSSAGRTSSGDNPAFSHIVSDPKISKLNTKRTPYMSTFD